MRAHPASYRDTSGYIFQQEGVFYRYVHPRFQEQYRSFMESGLYDELVKKNFLIPHKELSNIADFDYPDGIVLEPRQLTFLNYPYEWSFDMWKDAALLTLRIALMALDKGMMLKDATPFNVQFVDGKPLFIDTLSVEKYEEGKPWIAYHQFTECFLGPMLLMHYNHPDAGKLFTIYPNGIPISVLVSLLPKRSRWNMGAFLHIHLQAKFAGKQNKKPAKPNNFSKKKMELLLKGLENFVQKLSPKKLKTTWDDYYSGTILGEEYLKEKTRIVQSFLNQSDFNTVIDLGANEGYFSLLVNENKPVVATDFDPNCINELYLQLKKSGRKNILPLVTDLTTPAPAIGFENAERTSLSSRLKGDMIMALALVHHLCIANNVPMQLLAEWLDRMGENLIIEFIPKEDEKVQQLLQHRRDIFEYYHIHNFRIIFNNWFHILKEEKIGKTGRVLFLMKRREEEEGY